MHVQRTVLKDGDNMLHVLALRVNDLVVINDQLYRVAYTYPRDGALYLVCVGPTGEAIIL